MKINAIKKACSDRGIFLVMDASDGRQWMCNGCAFWPIDGITVTKDAIPALFDLNAKKQGEVVMDRREYNDERLRLEPMAENEFPLKVMGHILDSGTDYLALMGENGLLLIDSDWLKPIPGDGTYRFFERWRKNSAPLVAVYADLFVGGLISAYTGETVTKVQQALAEIVSARPYSVGDE